MPGVCLILTKSGGYSEEMIPTVIKLSFFNHS